MSAAALGLPRDLWVIAQMGSVGGEDGRPTIPWQRALRDTRRAMSQENVEIVRRLWRAYFDGGLDAVAEFWDEDIDWRAAEGAPDDVGEMHGVDAMRRYVGEWIDMFDGPAVVLEEVRDVGDDRVFAVQRISARAKLSGIETEIRYAVVYTVRDGKIVRGREYLNVEQALEAVGLSG
jgi:ketosteroid isomerase-like protein